MGDFLGFEEITDGLIGQINAFCDKEKNIAVVKCSDRMAAELDENLEDENWQADCQKKYEAYLEESRCMLLLFIWRANEEINFLCFSKTKRTRALEFLDYLITEFGLVRGNENCAYGKVATAILKVQMAAAEVDDVYIYFMKKSKEYFLETVCIDAGNYACEHAKEIEDMPIYQKKRVAWAYVKSTDVVSEGRKIFIKSLENTSGFEITASDDVYIMIGSRGEIYDIKRDKFENSYEAGEEMLNVFEQILDFLPAVEILPDHEYVALDEQAHLCYPKADAGIKAVKLSERTKIFPVMEDGFYHLGHAGDYMAVRLDDNKDIYVIQSDIFQRTYELKDEESE